LRWYFSKIDDPSYPGKPFYLSDAGENPAIHGEEGCPPKADLRQTARRTRASGGNPA